MTNRRTISSSSFFFGEKTGRKADNSEVSKTIRKPRNEDGSLLFQSDEYLTSLQIASFFSRLAAKKSVLVSSSTSDLANEDYCDVLLSEMAEKELEEMSQEVINELSNHISIVKHLRNGRNIEAFKIFDSNVRGNLQVLRT